MAELPPCTAHWEYFLAGLLQQYSTQPGPASTGRAQKAASCLLGSSLVCSIPLTLLRGCLAGRSCTWRCQGSRDAAETAAEPASAKNKPLCLYEGHTVERLFFPCKKGEANRFVLLTKQALLLCCRKSHMSLWLEQGMGICCIFATKWQHLFSHLSWGAGARSSSRSYTRISKIKQQRGNNRSHNQFLCWLVRIILCLSLHDLLQAILTQQHAATKISLKCCVAVSILDNSSGFWLNLTS